MFWADTILQGRKRDEIINDAWTPSGMVHMGSLKGPVMHDVLFRILKEQKRNVKFMYGFDDADPLDGLPPDLVESHSKYMGVPIHLIPSPDGNGSFADFFRNKLKKILDDLGIQPELYNTSDHYKDGTFDKAIRFVLDHASEVREVYEDIYKKKRSNDWFPLQVICPTCGKLGTTRVTGWDGEKVDFICEPNLVTWAQGCGAKDKISPFRGNSKMPYKVEWAAKWWTYGVTIEGAGKDHASAGGTYDVALRVLEDVFKTAPPLKFSYEFFLSGGKKMSSSKGIGLNGEELLEVLAPEVARFLMIKSPPQRAVEFTPRGTDTIPRLYDEYGDYARAYFGDQKGDNDVDKTKVFKYSQIKDVKHPPTVRFSQLVQWVQMPNMQQKIKEEGLEEWAKYAKIWIERFAPESEKFTVKKDLPKEAEGLTEQQKAFLQEVSHLLDKEWDAEEFQKTIYEKAKEMEIPSKDAFGAIYISLLGKSHGPKAGWLILSLDKEFVKRRFEEVSQLSLRATNESEAISYDNGIATSVASGEPPRNVKAQALYVPRNDIEKEMFSIDSAVKEKYSSISIGIAVIKGVTIEKSNPELEKEKEELLKSLENLTTEQLGEYEEVKSYRKLYKEMGVDWHSRRPSPEALLRRVALKKGLYTVNTCVDAYNLVVMRNRVSVGAFDLDKMDFPTILRFPKEGEEILLLGDTEPTKYKETELAYFDQKGGYNIDFNFRDAQRTAVQIETKNLYINVDGIYDITPSQVEKTLREAVDSIMKYCGGTLEELGVVTS